MIPSPNDVQVFTALRTFLVAVLPSGVDVVRAQQNRVPEPQGVDFVVMTENRRTRLETNIDAYADVRFTGSIAGTVMTVVDVDFGAVLIGAKVFGVGVAPNTEIIAQLSGAPGAAGTYTVTPSQAVSSTTLSSGAKTITQHTQVAMQLDIHGPNSADNAQVISTVFRDEAGVQLFEEQNSGVVPLYADDPTQRPFLNAEQAYEWRWVVEAMLQVNPVLSLPQQYADSVDVEVISVDAVFPPA